MESDGSQTQAGDVEQIEQLIERWALAVHEGDIEGVLRNHAEDIVMFDVPPPEEGVRGIEAYRRVWPDFFRWQESGASFEVVSLDVTAGVEVAFAHALVRCGSAEELAAQPDRRMRLTLGLRKQSNGWKVAHEHHSFTYSSTEATSERELRDLHQRLFERTSAKDLDGLMEPIAEEIVSYEHDAPLEHVGLAAVREVCRAGLAASEGAIGWTVPELQVIVREDLAVAWGLNRMSAEVSGRQIESWSRGTRIFRRTAGGWTMVHQHLSYPYDPATGEAKTDLRPNR